MIARLYDKKHEIVIEDIEDLIIDGVDEKDKLNSREKISLGEKIAGEGKNREFMKSDLFGKYYIGTEKRWIVDNWLDKSKGMKDLIDGDSEIFLWKREDGKTVGIEEIEKIRKYGVDGKKDGIDNNVRIYYLDRCLFNNLIDTFRSYRSKRGRLIQRVLNKSMMEAEIRQELSEKYLDRDKDEKFFYIYLSESMKKIEYINQKMDNILNLFEKIAPTPEEKLLRTITQDKAKTRVASEVRSKYIEFENQKIIKNRRRDSGLVYDMSKVVEEEMKSKREEMEKDYEERKRYNTEFFGAGNEFEDDSEDED
jgi:hypothetical protein